MPGSGKSFVWNLVRQHFDKSENWSYESVSSDAVRGEMIREVMAKDKCSRDDAFAKTMKSGPAEFAARLKRIVRNTANSDHAENHLVFLDKNHPEN